jgi:hypothetical protein
LTLYHATFEPLPLGKPISARADTPLYQKEVEMLETARPIGKPSRKRCVFATDNLAGATKFALKQYPKQTDSLQIYIIEMELFHKAPMRIVHGLQRCLEQGGSVDALVQEYWRPERAWYFYEFFGPALTPIAKAKPATDSDIMVFDTRYIGDGDLVRCICEATMKENMMKLTTEEFRHALGTLLSTGEELGFTAVDINAGNLHRRVGGYPGENHRMPMCCEAMRQAVTSGDVVVSEPPSGQGASLTIRYSLPRPR